MRLASHVDWLTRAPRVMSMVSLMLVGCGGGSSEPNAFPSVFFGLKVQPQDTATVVGTLIAMRVVFPEGTAAGPVAWVSSDTTVATVDVAGRVRGVRVGVALVTASTGTLAGTARVTIKP